MRRPTTLQQCRKVINADKVWAKSLQGLDYGDIVSEVFDRTDIYFDNKAGVHEKIVQLVDAIE
tara:strand:+ start:310 stop:498 length:189 start_codon:yes stop_codon:yes gene_type:complete